MKLKRQLQPAVLCITACIFAALATRAIAAGRDRAEFVDLWGKLGAELMKNEDRSNINEEGMVVLRDSCAAMLNDYATPRYSYKVFAQPF